MSQQKDDHGSREFIGLLVPNERKLKAFILMLVPNLTDAEDIYQEVVSEMWSRFSTFQIGTDFLAWAQTIAKYKVLAFRDKHKRSKLIFNSNVSKILETAAAATRTNVQKHLDLLQECVRKLSEKEKYLLKMRYEDELTFQQIAMRVGKTPPALHRAIAAIHSKLALCIRHFLRMEGNL